MKIIPLAFDSLGTRSMSTYVKTKDVKILIDPAVSLSPIRFGFMPHPKEISRQKKQWETIKNRAKETDIIIVSHYHLDHYNPDDISIYKGKKVFLKHPKEMINQSQSERAGLFIPKIRKIAKELTYADGKVFEFGKTKVTFSPPVYHGINDKLGYVIQTLVDDGKERFIHTSDVEGPAMDDQLEFIIKNNPTVVFLDGPLSYMIYKYGNRALETSFQNMMHIMEDTDIKKLIVDHHYVRDPEYKERIERVTAFGKKHNCDVCTAAEFLGKKIDTFEARRKELYGKK